MKQPETNKRDDHYVNLRTPVFNLLKAWCATHGVTLVDTVSQWVEDRLRSEAGYKLSEDELADVVGRSPSEQP